jgi:copper(I)-binding protein
MHNSFSFTLRRLCNAAIRAGLIASALGVVAIPGPAAAHSYKLGKIEIGHIWAPPPAPGSDGIAIYGPLFNSGSAPAALVGASSPIAKTVRFRVKKKDKVTWQKSIKLAPGKPVGMARWRVHLWASGLKSKLKQGDAFPMTLDFGPAGKLDMKVLVEKKTGH